MRFDRAANRTPHLLRRYGVDEYHLESIGWRSGITLSLSRKPGVTYRAGPIGQSVAYDSPQPLSSESCCQCISRGDGPLARYTLGVVQQIFY